MCVCVSVTFLHTNSIPPGEFDVDDDKIYLHAFEKIYKTISSSCGDSSSQEMDVLTQERRKDAGNSTNLISPPYFALCCSVAKRRCRHGSNTASTSPASYFHSLLSPASIFTFSYSPLPAAWYPKIRFNCYKKQNNHYVAAMTPSPPSPSPS